MQPKEAVETEVAVENEDEPKEVKPTHAAPKRNGSKQVQWDIPSNSYWFEMGFHPDLYL